MTKSLSIDRARSITDAFASKHIVVLGDLMLDEFIWGRVRRISPEAPVPVVEVERRTQAIGGAGNVVSNLVALGGTAIPMGVVGDDDEAARLCESITRLDGEADGIVTDSGRPTTFKTRIVAHNQQVVRADRESRTNISAAVEEKIIERFLAQVDRSDAVIVSDYSKGLLTPRLLNEVLTIAEARSVQ